MTAPRHAIVYAEYDPVTLLPIVMVTRPYDGPWAECKKGREAQSRVTDQSLANSKTDQATRQAELGAEDKDLTSLDVGPGGMSGAAGAQLSEDLSKINNTYNNAGQVGLKSIAQRGFGGPSGAASSLSNTLLRSRASDENTAYDEALKNSHNDMLAAIQARQGLQNIYDPNRSLGTASESALDQSRMGSTLGDIGAGLTTVAGLATGGYNLGNAIKNNGQSNGFGGRG